MKLTRPSRAVVEDTLSPLHTNKFCPESPSSSLSRSVLSSLLHRLQHGRLPRPSPSPGVCSNPCALSWCCLPALSSSFAPFSCPQSFLALGSFPMSRLFVSGGQSIGASANKARLGDRLTQLEGKLPFHSHLTLMERTFTSLGSSQLEGSYVGGLLY